MASTPLSKTATAPSPNIAIKKDYFDLQGLAPELRDMVYDEIHQQEDIMAYGNQLIVRYTSPPARYERVSRGFANEINRRTPRNPVHKLEITQKNIIFLPDDESWNLPEKVFPDLTDGLLTMNFNINESPENTQREMADKLFEWLDDFVGVWEIYCEPPDSAAFEASLPVTLRLWFCSMEVFDKYLPDLDDILRDKDQLQDFARIELMFYEREDSIAFPDETAVAGAKRLQVNRSNRWEIDDEAMKEAREVSARRVYKKVDPTETDWNDKSFSDEEGSEQGGDSDGESSGDNEYSGEEDLDLGSGSDGESSEGDEYSEEEDSE